MQHATCTLPDCAKPHEAKGYCATHYQRWLRTGDPYPRCRTCGTVVSSSKRHYCSDDCKPRCSVEGCESPQRKMGWCAAHYANHQQGREVKPFAYKWAGKGQPCQVCGEPTGSSHHPDGPRWHVGPVQPPVGAPVVQPSQEQAQGVRDLKVAPTPREP